jgi:acyl-CoA synthetase (AMP-forming)/AMP-acid ligase II
MFRPPGAIHGGKLAVNLIEMFRSAAERAGDDRGVRFYTSPTESEYLGYRQLDQRGRAVASALAARGVVPGEVVVVALNSGFDYIDAMYGIIYSGAAIVPTAVSATGSPDAMADRIRGVAAASGARLVLTERSVLQTLSGPIEAGVFDGLEIVAVAELLASGDADAWVEPALGPDALASLLFTSGSTGDPKGVMTTHESLLAALAIVQDAGRTNEESVVVGWMPFHHAMGLILQLLLPIFLASSVVLTSTEQFQRRPILWLQLMSIHRATFTLAANFAFGLCTQFATDEQVAELDLSSLDVVINGGEPVRTATIREFLDRFASTGIRESTMTPALGMTESMLVSAKPIGTELTVVDVDAAGLEAGDFRAAAPGTRAIEMVSCGVACEGCNIVVVDPVTEVELEDGRLGEIWLASPGASIGYWNNPEATRAVFGGRLADDDRNYIRTGDLGALVDGQLFITGRVKDLIIVRGRNIYPQDIEAAATAFDPLLGPAVAFELTGHPSEVGLVVEFDDGGSSTTEQALAERARSLRLSLVREFSLPSLAVGLTEPGGVPRTAAGKVRRSFTRTSLEENALPMIYSEGFSERSVDLSTVE